jgi:predicted PurR-regulated permease PerM
VVGLKSSCVTLFIFSLATYIVVQGAITQLSEQISSLNDRMDEFTTCIEELNSKLTIKKNSPSQQNMALQAEVCNGSAPASYFVSGLGNASLNGSRMFNSSSSSQLAKESPLMEEVPWLTLSNHLIIILCTCVYRSIDPRQKFL